MRIIISQTQIILLVSMVHLFFVQWKVPGLPQSLHFFGNDPWNGWWINVGNWPLALQEATALRKKTHITNQKWIIPDFCWERPSSPPPPASQSCSRLRPRPAEQQSWTNMVKNILPGIGRNAAKYTEAVYIHAYHIQYRKLKSNEYTHTFYE